MKYKTAEPIHYEKIEATCPYCLRIWTDEYPRAMTLIMINGKNGYLVKCDFCKKKFIVKYKV